MSYPQSRKASPQAWRRLRKTMSAGELRDIAQDITNVVITEPGYEISANIALAIEYAMRVYPWDEKRQA